MNDNTFTDRVKLAAENHWDDILQTVCGLTDDEVNPRKKNIPCPYCGGRDRYTFMSASDGHYFCRHCKPGDGFTLMKKILCCTFPEAVNQLAQYLRIERQPLRNVFEEKKERERINKLLMIRKRERLLADQQAETAKRQEEARVAAKVPIILSNSKEADPNHPYLIRKHLPPLGIRQAGQWLMVPLYADGHRLVNIEQISPNGSTKKGLKGGQRKGVYHRFGDHPTWTVYVCEGWATGASLVLLESHAVRVYAAMGKGNLECVAHIARRQNPESRIFIAADNDDHQQDNPGLTDAIKAAYAIGGSVIFPVMSNHDSKGTDFSDYFTASVR